MTARFTLHFVLQLGVDPSNSRISHRTVIKKVAKWARDNNRDNESDPLQFDVAVLIRRYKLTCNNIPCESLYMAGCLC